VQRAIATATFQIDPPRVADKLLQLELIMNGRGESMPRPSTSIDWSVIPWDELAATGDELLTVLDDERDALLGRDLPPLERTVERKLALLSSIETMLKAHAARPLQEHGVDTLLRARVTRCSRRRSAATS